MSGVVYGLFGYAWMKSRFDRGAGIYIDPGTVFMMVAWLVLCYTGTFGSVANTAHSAGLAVGMAIGYFPLLMRR
jgi:GlpG protein